MVDFMQEHRGLLMHVADLLADRLKQLLWADALSNEGAKDLVKVLGVHPRHSGSPHAAYVHKLSTQLLRHALPALTQYTYL